MRENILRGFKSLFRFSGRDSRGQFWPYCGTIFVLAFLANFLLFGVVIWMVSAENSGDFLAFEAIIAGVGLWAFAAVLLLAAAVTRRLHDTGRAGYWGLAPLPFLFSGFFLMSGVMTDFTESSDPFDAILPLFANNMLYLVLLGALIFQLSKGTQAEENRYGLPPMP